MLHLQLSCLSVLLLAVSSGCAASPTLAPSAAIPTRANWVIGAPCRLAASRTPEASPKRVFFEVALVEGDFAAATQSSHGSLGDAWQDPRLKIWQVAHALAPNEVDTHVSLARKKAGAQAVERWDLTLTAHPDAAQPDKVRFEMYQAPAPGHGAAKSTSVVEDQQMAVFPTNTASGAAPHQVSVIVTPYVVNNDGDLVALLECKLGTPLNP